MCICDRLAQQLSQWLEEARILEWMTKGKTNLIQKEPPPPKTHQQQLKTDNIST